MMRIAHHLHVTGELSLCILMCDQNGVNCSSYLVSMDCKHLEGTILAADILLPVSPGVVDGGGDPEELPSLLMPSWSCKQMPQLIVQHADATVP